MAPKSSKQIKSVNLIPADTKDNQCLSCLIVLNQDTCYFSDSSLTGTDTNTAKHTGPQLTTSEHRNRAPKIFTTDFLPPLADNDSILKSLVNNPDYTKSKLSRTLLSRNPQDAVIALNRLHHARSHSTFYRYVADIDATATDLATPTTVTPQLELETRNKSEARDELINILQQEAITHFQRIIEEYHLSKYDPLIPDKINDLTTLVTQHRSTTDKDLRRLTTEVSQLTSTARSLSPPNVPTHGRSASIDQTFKPQRPTPPPPNQAKPAHHQIPAFQGTFQSLRSPPQSEKSAPRPLPSAKPTPPPPHQEAEQRQLNPEADEPVSPFDPEVLSEDDEEDTRSVHSNGTVYTVNTSSEHSPPHRRSYESESPVLARPESLKDCSTQNLQDWIDYLSTQTSRFKRPPSNPKKDVTESVRIFKEYVTKNPSDRNFAKRLTEEILHTIKSARSTSRSNRA